MASKPGTTSFRSFLRYGPRGPQRLTGYTGSGGIFGVLPPGLVPHSGQPVGAVEWWSKGTGLVHQFLKNSDYDATNDWTRTQVAGTGDASIGADSVCGAHLTILNSGADNDETQIQRKNVAYVATTDKLLYFEARVQVTDATLSTLFVGLGVADTTFLAGATDFIGFQKAKSSTTLNFVAAYNGGAGGALVDKSKTVLSNTMTSSTWVKLAFALYMTSAAGGSASTGEAMVFVDDTHVQTVNLAANIPDGTLVPTFAVKNGEAAAKALAISSTVTWQEF